ncbi:MAG: hypothetical protein NT096_11115 [Proteobacteria bacterium]|nr:hypothetical protein [Pseudomonadota bacterium]
MKVSADRDALEQNYDEWLQYAEEGLMTLKQEGIIPVKVDIDVDKLVAWCRAEKRSVNAEARVAYVCKLLSQAGKRKP